MNTTDKIALGQRLVRLREGLRLTSRQMALSIGADPSYYSKGEKGQGISIEYLDKIIQTYQVPREWLLLGTNWLLRVGDATENPTLVWLPDNGRGGTDESFVATRRAKKLSSAQPSRTIPFYDAQALAGLGSDVDMSPTERPSSQIDIGDFLRDSTAAIRVYGNSMLPNYPPGCVIGLVPNEDGIIQPGEVYVVETATNRYIKRLYYNEDRSAYICYSDNTMRHDDGPMAGRFYYDKFEIPLEKVKRVFEVTGVIKRNRNSIIVQK